MTRTLGDILNRVRAGTTTIQDAELIQAMMRYNVTGVVGASQIAEMSTGERPLISPYIPKKQRMIGHLRVPSFGQDESGYSISPTDEWQICVPDLIDGFVIDVCGDGAQPVLIPHVDRRATIEPRSFILARSVEHFHMPTNVLGLAVGKSTYARCGVHPYITPLEPGWSGYLTMEIANHSPYPAYVYAYAGIAQIVFFWLSEDSQYTGPYQDQAAEIVHSRVS